MIVKQQKVIRHLLQKKGAAIDPKILERLVNSTNESQADNGYFDLKDASDTSMQIQKINNANSNKGKMIVDSDTTSRQKRLLQQNWSSIKSDPDFQAATDSDSAIMLEDHIAEVCISDLDVTLNILQISIFIPSNFVNLHIPLLTTIYFR